MELYLCLKYLEALYLLFLFPFALSDPCTRKDYTQYVTPCDVKTRTRSVVYYLNRNCQGGINPPSPRHGIPCDCPPGQGLSGNQTDSKCLPCEIGEYGSGGETIDNWKDWTNNGTMPPDGSDIITYCEISRSYIKVCQPWKASADNFTLNSGDNTLSRCMTSVLLMPNKKFVMDNSQVSFDYRVDSRHCRSPGFLGCDGLAFYIDNQQMLEFQGNLFQWSTLTYNLTAGTHSLKWVFRKNCFSFGSVSYVDKAFIRSITLVGTVEPNVKCKQCPQGYFNTKKGSSSCTPCSYFQYQSEGGQRQCKPCPPDTYAMLGASKCLPLPNCTTDDIIDAPGDLNTCSCTPPQSGTQCNTTVHPYFVTVQGLNGARLLCKGSGSLSHKLETQTRPCRCQPGFELKNNGGKLECKACEKGQKSSGLKCEGCAPGHVALAGKHYYIWRNNTLPDNFTAKCAGDCSVKGGWISSGKLIRTARVVGEVHSELQSPMFEVGSELGRIVFNCSVTCNLTGVPLKTGKGEHLAKIQHCNLIFQVLYVNGTVVEQVNCTRPKGRYTYRHETKRDGQIMNHIHSLKKGNYSFRWVFHQEDDSRTLSTAFEAKVFNISVLGVTSGEAQNCTACPAGYHSIANNTDCAICPNGTASSPGSEKCTPCKDGFFAAQEGSEKCLPCGNHTKSLPRKDGCSTSGCTFTAAPGVVYDLSKLSRPGGPMIEALLDQKLYRGSFQRSSIWSFQPSFYVNLCTVDHDNTSCTYLDRATRLKIPQPVMACRASWYTRDLNVGTVIGYRPKEDIRSGLFVDLLHGDKCYRRDSKQQSRYSTVLDLRCDVTAGVGNPGRENRYTDIMRGNCQYYFVWKSLYACPKCRESDVKRITGECINGTRNITYVRSLPCWSEKVVQRNQTEDCVMPTVMVTVKVPVNGTVAYVDKETNKTNMALIGVGVVVIVALLAVAGFFVYKHRIMKYRYYTLMARNKPMSRLEQEDDENNFITEDELAATYDEMSPSVRT